MPKHVNGLLKPRKEQKPKPGDAAYIMATAATLAAGAAEEDEAMSYGFLAGFIAGQADKVMNGVCPAAVISRMQLRLAGFWSLSRRPEQDFTDAVTETAKCYGLELRQMYEGDDTEFWLYREDDDVGVAEMLALLGILGCTKINTSLYHQIRAKLCGIPIAALNLRYHEADA